MFPSQAALGRGAQRQSLTVFPLGLSLWDFIPQAFIEHQLCARVLVNKADRPPEFTFGHTVTVPHAAPYVRGALGSEEESRMAS